MPSQPLQYCLTPGCSQRVKSGHCDKHKAKPQYDINRPSSSKRHYDRHWKPKRDKWLSEHPYCVECQRNGIVRPANEVDHIIPLSKGGVDNESNYQSMCKPHHSIKTWKENHSDTNLTVLIHNQHTSTNKRHKP